LEVAIGGLIEVLYQRRPRQHNIVRLNLTTEKGIFFGNWQIFKTTPAFKGI